MEKHDDIILIVRGDFSCEVNLPAAIETLKVPQIRKLFSILNEWENDETRKQVRKLLDGYLMEAKDDWDKASVKYQSEFKEWNYESYNKKLLKEVKDAKRHYDKICKFIDFLED